MPLSPAIENNIRKALIDQTFSSHLDFEDVCNQLLRRLPQYRGLRTSKLHPFRNATGKMPDAYIYLEDEDKWIVFEYTTTDRPNIRKYVKKLVKRNYLTMLKGRIKELILIFSHSLEMNETVQYKGELGTNLQCESLVFDNQDLTDLFTKYAVDLIQPILGVKCHPKWFQTIEDSIEELSSRYISFPTQEDFTTEGIYLNKELLQVIESRICRVLGPTLLTGRWGSGKTVFALSLGYLLKQNYQFSVYYIDLGAHVGRDERTIISEVTKKALGRLNNPDVVFIIDNAHFFPRASYRFAQWALKEMSNVLLVSRPVPKEMCDERQYFPELFSVPEVDTCESDGIEGTGNSSDNKILMGVLNTQSKFTIRPHLGIITAMINRRLKELQSDYRISDSDILKTRDGFANNLTLLAIALSKWAPDSGPIYQTDLAPVYGTLMRRFQINRFPEMLLLAALNYFDCPADVNVVFDTPEKLSEFLSVFFSVGGEAQGLLIKRGKRISGIHSAEAKLICEAGLFNQEICIRDGENRMPSSIYELLKLMILRYAARRPANPYELLRALRWTAFEARLCAELREEEEVADILSSVIRCPEFNDYLISAILPNSLSMVGMGNIARLYNYLRLPRQYYSKVFSECVIERGIKRYEQQWCTTHPDLDHFFTWREFFAWRHLMNLDASISSFFLTQFDYSRLLSYGSFSLRGLSNVLFMAGHTEWLRKKLISDIQKLFGNSEEFGRKIMKANEVQLVFLIRNATLVGDSAINCFSTCLPAKSLSDVVKQLPKCSGNIFHSIYRYMPNEYYKEFSEEFNENEIYHFVYHNKLSEIHIATSDRLFQRFLAHDFVPKVTNATFPEIQGFLRNLCFHGFNERQRKWAGDAFWNDKVKNLILNMLTHDNHSLSHISYFIRHTALLDPALAKYYLDDLSELGFTDIINAADLFDVSQYIFSIWLSGIVSVADIFEQHINQAWINRKIGNSTIRDFLSMGGLMKILEFKLSIPVQCADLGDRIGRYLGSLQCEIGGDDVDTNIQNRALNLALNLHGLSYLGGIFTEPLVLQYFDLSSAFFILNKVKDEITRKVQTNMTIAFDKLPVVSGRKVQLIQGALDILAQ